MLPSCRPLRSRTQSTADTARTGRLCQTTWRGKRELSLGTNTQYNRSSCFLPSLGDPFQPWKVEDGDGVDWDGADDEGGVEHAQADQEVMEREATDLSGERESKRSR